MHQSSLHTWRSIIAVVFPGTGLFYTTLVLSENHLALTYPEAPPHALAAFSLTHKALRTAWHATGVLYFAPALCGESFYPAKQTTHVPTSACAFTPPSQTLQPLSGHTGYCSRCVLQTQAKHQRPRHQRTLGAARFSQRSVVRVQER